MTLEPTRTRRVLLAVTSAALAVSGCGLVNSPAPADVLTLYSAQHQQTTAALVSAFTARTGVRVRVEYGDEDVLEAQIQAEGRRSPADLFYTENSNWLTELDDRHLLQALPHSILDNVPVTDQGRNGDWVGVSARVSVLDYITESVRPNEVPTSVLALADSAWRGRIEIAPTETDFWPIICSVASSYGDQATVRWLRGLKVNAGSGDQVPDNETLTSDVNSGTTDLALINSYYYYRLRATLGPSGMHSALAYLAPHDPGYVEDVSGIAVLASSVRQNLADRFVSFVTGPVGQAILARSTSFEYPLHPGIAASPELPPLSDLKPAPFTPADLGTGQLARSLLQEAGLI
jgi:iron(III) transport system substrate-binding protein